jgi:uncharacterized protein (TIGR00290 family)
MKPKAAIAWSSGKDCAYALYQVQQSGEYDVCALFTTINETHDRVAMHGTRNALLQRQADALGLELITVGLPWPCDNDTYQQRMAAGQDILKQRGIDVVIFGDLFLEDIRAYRENIMRDTGMTPVFPLWDHKTHDLMRDMLADGFDMRIVTCDPTRVPAELAGQKITPALIDTLPDGVDPCGENGEFHTVVVNMPLFSAPILVNLGDVVTRDGYCYADVIPTA